MVKKIIILFAIFLLLGCVTSYESEVNMKVTDSDNVPVVGASIVFSPLSDNGFSHIFVTGSDGKISGAVLAGKYNITASKSGYFSDVKEKEDLTKVKDFIFVLEKKAE